MLLVLLTCVVKAAASLGVMVGTSVAVPGRAWIYVLLSTGFTLAGLVIVLQGRHDRRATSLGAFFALIGSIYTDPVLLLGSRRMVDVGRGLDVLAAVQIAALMPYYFWRFVQDFPRRLGPYESLRFARVATGVALAVGLGLLASHLLLLELPVGLPLRDGLATVDRRELRSLYWPLLIGLTLPVLPYIAWKTRYASSDERRRARVLLMGILVGIVPSILLTIIEMLSPRVAAMNLTPTGRVVVGLLVYPPLLAIPITTAYAIVVHRALDVRLIVRKAIQYALARSSLVVLTATPFLALSSLVYRSRHLSLSAVTTGRQGGLLIALTAVGLSAVAFRPKLLRSLDRRFFREQYDAHAILASLVERAHVALDADELATSVPQEIERALHVESAALLVLDRAEGALRTPSRTVPPLLTESELARRLPVERDGMEIEWSRRGSWVHELPEADRHWLLDSSARLIVPILGRDRTLAGALLLGEKRSSLPFSREDRALLRSVAQAVAPALGREIDSASRLQPDADEADRPAGECPACGRMEVGDTARCRRCDLALVPSALPVLLAGKFVPIERVGSGGMGVVYRATDLSLGRDVALKTLPQAAPAGAARMRREARAMAAVSHANLESIHSLESWRGTPILIVEFLEGGTLDVLLRQGSLEVSAALGIAVGMSDALGRLHRAGILHRDIKPSNIGFDGDGTVKLLDFGLAWMLEAASVHPTGVAIDGPRGGSETGSLALTGGGEIVGTVPYLSPESLDGAPLSPAVDLWALSMVTYEAIAGRHPFAGANVQAMMFSICHADVPNIRELNARVEEPVASFLSDCLSRDLSRRPASAHEWRNRASRLQH